MRHFVLPAFVALLMGGSPPSPRPQENNIAWAKTWEAAKHEAKTRNVPILYTAHKDG